MKFDMQHAAPPIRPHRLNGYSGRTGSRFEPDVIQNGSMLKSLLIPLWIVGFALQPWLMLAAIAIGIVGGIVTSKLHIRESEAPHEKSRTIDGRFPILNKDWVGALVLSIDDAEVPEVIRRHGARFRNPARFCVDLGNGEYLLYDGDGELLDMCVLK